MAVTTNGTPTDAWTLVHSATSEVSTSYSCRMHDVELIIHDSGSTPPADTLFGHDVLRGRIEPGTLKSGDHLWHRIRRTSKAGTADDVPVSVFTIQT